MMFWLIRTTQVTRLIYQLVLATMMTLGLLNEGKKNLQKRKALKRMNLPHLAS